MSSLQSYIDKQKYKNRYETQGYFLTWLNELLEELTERGFMPSMKKECGQIVIDNEWIEKPADLVTLREVYSPDDKNLKFRTVELNGKFKLQDFEFEDEDLTSDACTALTSPTVDSITVNLTGKTADEYKNSLFVITAGTYAGRTYILSGNDATVTTTTKLYFLHDLEAALSGTTATAAAIHPSTSYVMLVYDAIIDSISSAATEIPITDAFEKRIVPAWLRWKSEQFLSSISEETKYWQNEVEKVLWSMEAGRSSKPINSARGRRLIGYESGNDTTISNEKTFTETHG